MRSRLFRLNLLSLAFALAAIALGGAVSRTPEERTEVTEAANIARRYDQHLSTFMDKANEDIRRKATDSVGKSRKLLALVDERINNVPKVPTQGTSAYGRDNSDAYQSTVARHKAVLGTYGELAGELRNHALPVESFLDAGRKLLLINPGELLKDTQVVSGWPIREHVIPEYEKAQAALRKQKAPPGEAKLFEELKDFAKDAIKDAKAGALKLDVGQQFYFNFGELPNQLYRRLVVIDTALKGKIVREVEAATLGI